MSQIDGANNNDTVLTEAPPPAEAPAPVPAEKKPRARTRKKAGEAPTPMDPPTEAGKYIVTAVNQMGHEQTGPAFFNPQDQTWHNVTEDGLCGETVYGQGLVWSPPGWQGATGSIKKWEPFDIGDDEKVTVITDEDPLGTVEAPPAVAAEHGIAEGDAPGVVPSVAPEAVAFQRESVWPEVEDIFYIKVPLDDETKSKLFEQFAALQTEKNSVESRKAAAAKAYNGEIAELEEKINAIAAQKDGDTTKPVKCRWLFEAKGAVGTNILEAVTDPKVKVLFRLDDDGYGEIVKWDFITERDRARELGFEPSAEECKVKIAAKNYDLLSFDDPAAGETAFQLHPNKHDMNSAPLMVPGDNEIDALRAAVLILYPPVSTDPVASAPPDSNPVVVPDGYDLLPESECNGQLIPGAMFYCEGTGKWEFETETGSHATKENAVAVPRVPQMTEYEIAAEKWREEGALARRNGFSRIKCPHAPASVAAGFWKAGHDAEDREIEKRMAESKAAAAAANGPVKETLTGDSEEFLQAIYDDGKLAAKTNKPRTDNPYLKGPGEEARADKWHDGYDSIGDPPPDFENESAIAAGQGITV